MQLVLTELSTDRFNFNAMNGVFTAEASDFNGLPFKFDHLLARVWDDACDVGFELVSARTGEKVVVTLVDEKTDNEGSILFWEFAPYRNESFNKVVIFND